MLSLALRSSPEKPSKQSWNHNNNKRADRFGGSGPLAWVNGGSTWLGMLTGLNWKQEGEGGGAKRSVYQRPEGLTFRPTLSLF